jgi:putative aldouronate transport system substrate-binding protein
MHTLTRSKFGLVFFIAAVCLTLGSLSLVSAQEPEHVLIWSPGDNGNVQDWANDPILQQVEAATNTDIEMVKIGWDTFTDQVNASIAAGQAPDIIGTIDHNNKTLINGWVRDGVIAPFAGDVAAAAPNIVAGYESNPSLEELKVEGNIYAVPVSWGTSNYPNQGLVHVRADLLEKYGMEPPTTFEQYFAYLDACKADGFTGTVFPASDGLGGALNTFAGAFGLPMGGWVRSGDGWGYWAVQPGIKDAMLLFRDMVARGVVDPISWEGTGDQARTQYVTGQACSFIFNGGGHIGRLQNDLTLSNPDAKEWLLPALDNGSGQRGYMSEPQFWGATFITQLEGNHPVAAARVLNYLASDEGYKLTSVGILDRDYTEADGNITLLPERTADGFPSEGDTGAHPLASTLVSWVPQSWQDFSLLYGKDDAFKQWYADMWANQGMYQITTYGMLSTSPLWTDFASTSADLINRTFVQIAQTGSADEAGALFDQFVSDWNAQGGTDATAEMSALLNTVYPAS